MKENDQIRRPTFLNVIHIRFLDIIFGGRFLDLEHFVEVGHRCCLLRIKQTQKDLLTKVVSSLKFLSFSPIEESFCTLLVRSLLLCLSSPLLPFLLSVRKRTNASRLVYVNPSNCAYRKEKRNKTSRGDNDYVWLIIMTRDVMMMIIVVVVVVVILVTNDCSIFTLNCSAMILRSNATNLHATVIL